MNLIMKMVFNNHPLIHAPNVETLDPGIRQYSDLPSWIDDKSEQLKGKRVLM